MLLGWILWAYFILSIMGPWVEAADLYVVLLVGQRRSPTETTEVLGIQVPTNEVKSHATYTVAENEDAAQANLPTLIAAYLPVYEGWTVTTGISKIPKTEVQRVCR